MSSGKVNASGDLKVSSLSAEDSSEKLRRSLLSIQKAALGACISAFMFVVWIGIWTLLGGFAERPKSGFNLVALGLGWVWAAIGNSVIMNYLHGNIRRRGKTLAIAAAANARSVVMFKDSNVSAGTPNNQFTGNDGSMKHTGSESVTKTRKEICQLVLQKPTVLLRLLESDLNYYYLKVPIYVKSGI